MKKNIIANFIGKFWGLVSGFIFIPLYIRYLGFESYSIISFTLVIAGLMFVLDAGLTATLSREFSRTDNSLDEKVRVFKTLESSYSIIIGLCIIVIIILSGFLANNWLIVKTFDPNRISWFLKIISFDVGFQLLMRFYMGGLLGLEKQVKANTYQVGWGILRNGFVVVAIIIIPTLEMFFIWQAISTIVFALLIGISLRKVLTGRYKFDFKPKIEKSVLKRIWRFASGMLLISLVASLNTQMDKLAISKLLPIESLGYYTLAVSLSMGIILLVNPISIALLPRFTALYTAGEKDEALRLFNKVNLYVAILVFSVMANMLIFAKELIWIWTGKIELAEKASLFVPFISISAAMLSIAMISYDIAIANGYTKLNNLLGILSLLITLPGYWIATKHYGAFGAASVYCVVQTTITLVYIYVINAKFLKGKRISVLYIKQMLFPMMLSLCISFGFSFIPFWVVQNRLYAFVWIGVITSITFSANILILIPLRDIKKIFKYN